MRNWKTLSRLLTAGAAGLLAALVSLAPAAAQETSEDAYTDEGVFEDEGVFDDEGAFEDEGTFTTDESDVYGLYDAGYDQTYGNDWFYDYYQFGDTFGADTYEYGYDYDTDIFDWEEDGLF